MIDRNTDRLTLTAKGAQYVQALNLFLRCGFSNAEANEMAERLERCAGEKRGGVYGPMCRDPKACIPKGYCPLDPNCAD